MLINRDVRERRRAENALRRAELLYRDLVESTRTIFWRGDAETFQFTKSKVAELADEANQLVAIAVLKSIEDFWLNIVKLPKG